MNEFIHQKHDQQIDQALRRLGSAQPRQGIEDRITARLARAEAAVPRPARVFGLPRFAFAAATATVACAAIVVGSVNHSRSILPVAPGIQLPVDSSSGIGAASAAHVATQQVAPSPNGRARSMRKTVNGRAVISQEAQKPAGVVVPKNPAPQSAPAVQQ